MILRIIKQLFNPDVKFKGNNNLVENNDSELYCANQNKLFNSFKKEANKVDKWLQTCNNPF